MTLNIGKTLHLLYEKSTKKETAIWAVSTIYSRYKYLYAYALILIQAGNAFPQGVQGGLRAVCQVQLT
jgi:late competence protein required for DNA uptake (superfamily II DNA/RNA helicase)